MTTTSSHGYALSTTHETGKNKQKVLFSAFGFTADDADDFGKQLIEGLKDSIVISTKTTEHGENVSVYTYVTGKNGHTERVRATWHYSNQNPYSPTLSTVYLKGKGGKK